jgi:hypothetical protein
MKGNLGFGFRILLRVLALVVVFRVWPWVLASASYNFFVCKFLSIEPAHQYLPGHVTRVKCIVHDGHAHLHVRKHEAAVAAAASRLRLLVFVPRRRHCQDNNRNRNRDAKQKTIWCQDTKSTHVMCLFWFLSSTLRRSLGGINSGTPQLPDFLQESAPEYLAGNAELFEVGVLQIW